MDDNSFDFCTYQEDWRADINNKSFLEYLTNRFTFPYEWFNRISEEKEIRFFVADALAERNKVLLELSEFHR